MKAQEGMFATAAELLVLSAAVVANPPPKLSARGVELSSKFVDAVLAAAKKRGYAHIATLRQMLGAGERTPRLLEMARAACRSAGLGTVLGLVDRLHIEASKETQPAQGGI